ncbi:hypothetical protein TNCV_4488271 [Trichonephila clavipes]|nr:hypothetical protein TNCV_4488271 [Trichonephila clavipes]
MNLNERHARVCNALSAFSVPSRKSCSYKVVHIAKKKRRGVSPPPPASLKSGSLYPYAVKFGTTYSSTKFYSDMARKKNQTIHRKGRETPERSKNSERPLSTSTESYRSISPFLKETPKMMIDDPRT